MTAGIGKILLLSACLAFPAAEAGAGEGKPLESIRKIRNLSVEDAAKGLPVKLRATVVHSRPAVAALFVHDGRDGIYIEQPSDYSKTGPYPGDLVEVTGTTGPGLFAPVVRRDPTVPGSLVVLDKVALPEPETVTGAQLARPNIDSEWVSVEARVLEVMMNGDGAVMECQAGPCRFNVLMHGPVPPELVPWDLAESQVKIRGVAGTAFNASRQMTRRLIRINSLEDIETLDPGLVAKAPARLARADELLQLNGPGPGDLVKLSGTATLAMAGRGFFLRTPAGGLWVQTGQPLDVLQGTEVEVEGWPRLGGIKPYLLARRAQVGNTGEPPEPQRLDAREALHSGYDSELISVEAELLDKLEGPEGTTLVLREKGLVFRGLLERGKKAVLPEYGAGSRLRVAGIAQISAVNVFNPMQEEDALTVLLRTPADVLLVAAPPWWTPRRVAMAAAFLIAVLLAAYAVARGRRLREQATKHLAFEAVLAERGRFAREIHDSLAQGLTSISLQLECVRDEIPDEQPKLRSHIETARRLVRDSLREARRTVWNLRPLALGEANLATALQRFAADLTRDCGISSSQEIEGTPRPLPGEHENALLRIGQEALTNATRHSGASEVMLRLRFGAEWVTLTVKDNGRGFDVAAPRKGFGLTGIQERVAALGGSISIDSIPGEGTEVSATLPT